MLNSYMSVSDQIMLNLNAVLQHHNINSKPKFSPLNRIFFFSTLQKPSPKKDSAFTFIWHIHNINSNDTPTSKSVQT